MEKDRTDENTFMVGEVDLEKGSEEGKVRGKMNWTERARYTNK